MKTVKPPDNNIEALPNKFGEVLQSIGWFQDKNTGKKIEVKLETDTEAILVVQKRRPVP